MNTKFRLAAITAIFVACASFALAGPGSQPPMPPTAPPMFAGPGSQPPMPPTAPPMFAGPGSQPPMPPTAPPSAV
jgi:hypothetical protein